MRPVSIFALVTALFFSLVSAPSASADPAEPTIAIEGTIAVGQPVTAVVSGMEGDIIWEWRIDGVPTRCEQWPTGQPIPDHRFFLFDEFVGTELSVAATVTPADGDPVTLTSASHTVVQGEMLANAPEISGTPRVGQTLTVTDDGILYPTEGVAITYRWLAWDQPIEGATGPTLTLGPEHVGLGAIQLELTATKDGWPTHVRRSAQLDSWVVPEHLQPGTIIISAEPVARQSVGFHESWDTSERLVTEEIQWLLDGRELAGFTDETITVDPLWTGGDLAVRVTKQRVDGSSSSTVTSDALRIKGEDIYGFVPAVGRQAVVGWPLRYDPSNIAEGITHKVEWVRVDSRDRVTPIPGARGYNYRITKDDIGYRVGVRYTLSGLGYETYTGLNVTHNATPLNVYTTPGQHSVNGREWRTSCEPYSQTIRCRTEIWATQVKRVGGSYTRVTGWVFNNLTYMPLTSGTWGSNPLARDVQWTDGDGRRWKTECERGVTCRTYTWQSVPTAYRSGSGWRYTHVSQWVFNNMVYVR